MNKISTQRLIIGSTIVLAGVLLLFESLGFTAIGDLLRQLWPIGLIVLGIGLLFNSKENYLWAILVIAVGNILLLDSLGLLEVNVWRLVWPVVVIVIGVSIILNRISSPDPDKSDQKLSKDGQDKVMAILSGTEQNNYSPDFKSAKITAVMGGVTYDLRQVTIKKEATIEIFSLWGGVELIMPENVLIQCTTMNLLGGVENKSRMPADKNAPVLRIIGDVVMAGVEIKN